MLTVAEAVELIDAGARVLDVREVNELEDGVIEQSASIPMSELTRDKATETLDRKGETTVVVCASGTRSKTACEQLASWGFTQAHSLEGGMNSWKAAGESVVPSRLEVGGLQRYQAQIAVPEIGVKGQLQLAKSRALIVGLGALGSPVALYLAGAGVGNLALADYDKVELSNLHRQILHTEPGVGVAKTSSAKQQLVRLNSDISVEVFDGLVDDDTAIELVKGCDVVIDAADNLDVTSVLRRASLATGVVLVEGSVYRFEGQVTVFDPAKHYADPANLHAEASNSSSVACSEVGAVGAVTGVVGSMQATEALKVLLGIESPLRHKTVVFDALDVSFTFLDS